MTRDDVPERSGDDRYLLRDRLWCEPCAAPMVSVLLSTGVRYYGCPYRECPRPLIDAMAIEQLAWHQFSLRYEGTTAMVATYLRREFLRQKLRRLRVGEDVTELRYEWVD